MKFSVPFLRVGLMAGMVYLAASNRAAAQTTNASSATSTELSQIITSHFAAWDLNQDGVLCLDELDKLIVQPKITGPNAAALAALKRASRSRKLEVPAWSMESIQQLLTNAPALNRPNLPQLFREGLTNLAKASSRDLFATGRPRLETIHQGKLGNCFCLAPLGAMVHRDPKQVAALFAPQPNGDFTVKLGQRIVKVTPPTDAEIAMTSSNESDGIWVNLYEKAVGQALNDDRPAMERAGSPLDALARGGSAGTMLAFLTGHEMTRFSFKFAKDETVSPEARAQKLVELRKQLAGAGSEKRLMTCGTLKTTTPGITPNHAYAVLSYEAGKDVVTLWNPHGGRFIPKGAPGLTNGYPQADGVFAIPTADFVQQFSGMAFEVLPVAASSSAP